MSSLNSQCFAHTFVILMGKQVAIPEEMNSLWQDTVTDTHLPCQLIFDIWIKTGEEIISIPSRKDLQ